MQQDDLEFREQISLIGRFVGNCRNKRDCMYCALLDWSADSPTWILRLIDKNYPHDVFALRMTFDDFVEHRSHHSSLQTWTNYFKAMRDALADGGVKVGGQSSGPLARDAEAEVTLEAPKLEDQTIIFSFRLSPALPAPGSDRELCDFEDAHLKATQEFLLHLLHEMKESARGEAAAVGRVSHNTASSALSPSGTGVGASSACSGREWAHRPQAPPGNGAPTLVRSAKSEELHRSEASPPDGAPLLVRNAKSAELPCKRVATKRGRGAKRNRTELEVVSDSSDSS